MTAQQAEEGEHDIVDVVMPARNEALTIAANIRAAQACRYVRDVIVVDDGSEDDTAARAAHAGAEVIRRHGSDGSKAHAMGVGVDESDASHILFVDADCTGLTGRHLDGVCEPVLGGRAEMSIGAFDYGWLNWVVLHSPPLSGERIVHRSLWELVPEQKLAGYTIETRLNEVVVEAGLRVAIRTMVGVSHRTKRAKFGVREGMRRTWQMYRDLVTMVRPFGDIDPRTYPAYLRNLTIESPVGAED